MDTDSLRPSRFTTLSATLALALASFGCSADGGVGNLATNTGTGGTSSSGGGGGTLGFGGSEDCGSCQGTSYISCDTGAPVSQQCGESCTPDVGCTGCSPQGTRCVGNEVHSCSNDGQAGDLIESCDASAGFICSNGQCRNGCVLAAEQPSNVGCEFYAVDLDLSDGVSYPGATPWAVILANAGQAVAQVTIEQTDSPFGQPPSPTVINSVTIPPGELAEVVMPTREIDCGSKPDDWYAPGTCLSRNAFRITSTTPIVVYQFNNVVHGWSTDASLLLPTTAIGTTYRVTGWPVAHSFPIPGSFVQRAYVTIIGTVTDTKVRIKPSWRLRGNGSIPATPAGETLEVTIGPFDVLNLETDDATLQECVAMQTAPFCADLTGTGIEASEPIVVFSGTEQSGVGLPEGAPMPPSWDEDSTGCCNQHLEEQLAPVESFGTKFLVTRSPVRSNPEFTKWQEPDVIRFVGAAAPAEVTTTLPAPYDKFTLAPGQILDTWTQQDFVATSTAPIVIAQFLVGQGYVEPRPIGDPSFTIFPALEQSRSEYVFLSPTDWKENWVVIGTEKGTQVTIDGAVPTDCSVHDVGELDGKLYEARRCPLNIGPHQMSGDGPFQIMAYGYADADAYAFPGGADIKKIYVPPPLF